MAIATGLGGGPARRVNPADAPGAPDEVADEDKTDAPVTPAAKQVCVYACVTHARARK